MTVNPDKLNGTFEFIGALFTWGNARKLWKDREIKGVHWQTTVFFALWGVWNLYYYPSLDQWFSFAGGCALVAGNLAWVCMAIGYTIAFPKAQPGRDK